MEIIMFENLKHTAKFEYKDSYEITDEIEEGLVEIEENSHKYASDNFVEILKKVTDQKEALNVTSVGENIFYHGIHFLKGRGWSEEQLLDAIKSHYHLYDEVSETNEGDLETEETKS